MKNEEKQADLLLWQVKNEQLPAGFLERQCDFLQWQLNYEQLQPEKQPIQSEMHQKQDEK